MTMTNKSQRKTRVDQQERTPEPNPIPRTVLSMSMQEFATSLRISRATAYLMLKNEMYKTYMIGRRRFVSVDEARALVDRLTSDGDHQ